MGLMESGEKEVKVHSLRRAAKVATAHIAALVLDQIYPPACPVCREPLADGEGLCPSCFSQLGIITPPYCSVLGVPFEVDLGPDAISPEALADPPPFARARAAVRYGEVAQALVSRLKFGDRPELARFCAKLMAQAGRDLCALKPVLVPIPLHPSRLRHRRYNQSLLLAQHLGRLLNLDVDPHLVRRHKKTRQQIGLSGDGRARNVEGAFSVPDDFLLRLRGRRLLLIDDVYTTGSTVKAASRTLLRAGAQSVDVLTFARVVIGEDMTI